MARWPRRGWRQRSGKWRRWWYRRRSHRLVVVAVACHELSIGHRSFDWGREATQLDGRAVRTGLRLPSIDRPFNAGALSHSRVASRVGSAKMKLQAIDSLCSWLLHPFPLPRAQLSPLCFAEPRKVSGRNAPFGLWQLLPHQKSFVSCRWCARLPSTGAPGSCVVGECVARRTGELPVSSAFGASQSDPHKSQFQTF